MYYYKITIYNESDVLVATYFKNADSCEEAILIVLRTIQLMSGDSIKVEEM